MNTSVSVAKLFQLWIFVNGICVSSFCQTNANETDIKRYLCGTTNKLWIFEGIIIRQSSESACSKGEAIQFFPSGTAKVIKCKKEVLIDSVVSWHVEKVDIDNFLTIGNHKFLFSIVSKPNDKKYEYLRLFQRQATGDRVLIKEYKYEKID